MHINISAKGIELTAAIKEYGERKMLALQRFFKNADEEIHTALVVGKETAHHKEGEVFMVEATISAMGNTYHSDEVATDLYAAIDKVQSELERMITTSKAKQESRFRRGGRRVKEMMRGLYRG